MDDRLIIVDSPEPAQNGQRNEVLGVLFTTLLLVGELALTIGLVGMVQDAREEARRSRCVGNLAQLGLALLKYRSDFGTLPPAVA